MIKSETAPVWSRTGIPGLDELTDSAEMDAWEEWKEGADDEELWEKIENLSESDSSVPAHSGNN